MFHIDDDDVECDNYILHVTYNVEKSKQYFSRNNSPARSIARFFFFFFGICEKEIIGKRITNSGKIVPLLPLLSLTLSLSLTHTHTHILFLLSTLSLSLFYICHSFLLLVFYVSIFFVFLLLLFFILTLLPCYHSYKMCVTL